jgi:ATPase
VEIQDFESGRLEYELYPFGKENIVVPIQMTKEASPIEKLAVERISQFIKRYDKDAQIQLIGENKAIVKVHHKVIAKLIGKDGKNIARIEKRLGIHIEVEPKR